MADRPAATRATSSKKTWWFLGGLGSLVVVGVAVGVIVAGSPSTNAEQAALARGAGAFRVVMATPSNNAVVDSNATVRVALSEPISDSSPVPRISPQINGTWQRLSPTTLEFVQMAPFAPGEHLTVTVPGGKEGLTSTSGSKLAASTTSTFLVSPMSLTRVQQLLAEEGYLPVSFTPAVAASTVPSGADEFGTFTWRFAEFPEVLQHLWTPGEMTTVTKAAIMQFEAAHQMPTDGAMSPQLGAALLADRVAGKSDPNPYTWVMVSRALPQTLQLYSNGDLDYTALVNLGIPGAETPSGTWPVYLRFRSQTMSGTNPDGTHYADPGVPFISYFVGGVALHGFDRASYGFPQSLGCVEMAEPDAAHVWASTAIGTLVNVD